MSSNNEYEYKIGDIIGGYTESPKQIIFFKIVKISPTSSGENKYLLLDYTSINNPKDALTPMLEQMLKKNYVLIKNVDEKIIKTFCNNYEVLTMVIKKCTSKIRELKQQQNKLETNLFVSQKDNESFKQLYKQSERIKL
jgi:hypothetical protein